MNIKTIKQLPSTKDLLNKVSVCCDENGNTYNWELNDLNLTFIKGEGKDSVCLLNSEEVNTASGDASIALGAGSTAFGFASHSEGHLTVASGTTAHAEGNETKALNDNAHSEGYKTTASGKSSHAEGQNTFTYADAAHSEGNNTHARAPFSHAEGIGTKTNPGVIGQHVEGYYNAESYSIKVIGCGISDDFRMNAVEVTRDGKVFVNGLGNFNGTNPDEAADLIYVVNSKANSNNVYNKTELDNILIANGEKYKTMVYVTYSELVALRNKSQLVPGRQYRITDYITTTTQSDTQSAGHPFDIIVTADDVNVLNENARAIQHEGETYFSNSDLNAWELKYCLDNDTNRFTWADAESYVEISIEVDDFFKNKMETSLSIPVSQIPDVLKFSWWDNPRNGTEDSGDRYSCDNIQLPADDFLCLVYPLGTDVIANPELLWYPNICLNGQPTEVTLEYDNDGDGIIDKKYIPTSIEFFNGKGVIYYMKDEWNNECPYDFKNIQFARWELSYYGTFINDGSDSWEETLSLSTPFDLLKTGFYGLNGSTSVFYYGNNRYKVEYTISESPTYCYTFGKDTDYSIDGSNYSNVIKEYKTSNKIQLNNIVFLSDNCFSNSFGHYCYSNSFGTNCSSNSFDEYCYNNSFSSECYSNSFGSQCHSNSFGNHCYNNSFGNECDSNSFDEYCTQNSFGEHCQYNSFGKRCSSNGFGNGCSYNSFGNYCSSNGLGTGCSYNSFGNECDSNSFGNNCDSNSFGNYCESNTLGDECNTNSFGNNCHFNSLGNDCDSNSFGDECSSNSFGESCDSNTFGNECTSNSFCNECSDNTFGNYCSSNSFGNHCHNNSLGEGYVSNSFGNECSSNSFGEYCYANTLGDSCSNNSLVNYCSSNSFGNCCESNTLGDECASNSFGNECASNSFGSNCSSNSFDNDCSNNSLGNNCYRNSLGNNCYRNSLGYTCDSNSFSNDCQYNSLGGYCKYNSFGNGCCFNSFGESKDKLKSYYTNIIFDNGNRYINLNCTSTTSSSNYYRNVRIGLGVNNPSTYKTINDANVGQTYQTLYEPTNSQTIKI